MFNVYFLEIRNRLVLIVFAWVLTFGICYWYKETLLFVFSKPLVQLYPEESKKYFIATSLTELFSSYMLISFFMANQLTMVFSISQIVIFITPALYSYEAKKIRNLFFFSLLLWLLNVIFLNSFMFSHVFNFFISFQGALFEQVTSVHFEIRVWGWN